LNQSCSSVSSARSCIRRNSTPIMGW
jgi:hypothetical protein